MKVRVVELKNTTDETIDLTGWEMRDKATRPESLSAAPSNLKKSSVLSRGLIHSHAAWQ